MIEIGRKEMLEEKSVPVPFCAAQIHLLGSNPGLCKERLASTPLSHGTAPCIFEYKIFVSYRNSW